MSEANIHSALMSVRKNLTRLGVTSETRLLIGVSGGIDSMVLLHMLHHSGQSVSAAHVNFNLRGADSINDALFVRGWCMDNGIPFYELSKDTKAFASEYNLNTQEA